MVKINLSKIDDPAEASKALAARMDGASTIAGRLTLFRSCCKSLHQAAGRTKATPDMGAQETHLHNPSINKACAVNTEEEAVVVATVEEEDILEERTSTPRSGAIAAPPARTTRKTAGGRTNTVQNVYEMLIEDQLAVVSAENMGTSAGITR